MRVVFMGTPSAAVPSLRAVASTHEIVAVYTQPPRGAGRGRALRTSPIHEAAHELGLVVREPASLREEAGSIAELAPDVIAVVAYGQLLRADVLAIPPLGCINVHFSLLPRWRGAAPVERAIMAGDAETGVTTMLMDAGLDTGPMLLVERTPIGDDETAGELTSRLAEMGAPLLVRTIAGVADGNLATEPQPAAGDTYAAKLTSADGELDPQLPAAELERIVRGCNPHPGASLLVQGRRVKVWRARVATDAPEFPVQAGLELVELQPEGKKRMSGADYARGYLR